MSGHSGKIKHGRDICTSNYVIMAVLSVLSVIVLIVSSCAGIQKLPETAVPAQLSVLSPIPEYDGEAFLEINNDIPLFTDSELTTETYLKYSKQDSLGRCGPASACLSADTLVLQGTKRGQIGHIKPSGWRTVKYDCIYEKYLYNRCHMIAWSLSGTLDDERNLITGTKYLNLSMLYGMELETLNYIRKTGNHVLYRATPLFDGNDLLCRGILMEAKSVEDDGAGLMHCRYFFNVQPGIAISYKDGSSEYNGVFQDMDSPAVNMAFAGQMDDTDIQNKTGGNRNVTAEGETSAREADYIINTNTGKFHLLTCPNAKKTKPQNRQYYTGSGDDLIARGYTPAGCCDP